MSPKLGLINKHIDRISKTVRDMVDFASPSSLDWEACLVNDLLVEALGIVRYDKRAKKATIKMGLANELPVTYAMR